MYNSDASSCERILVSITALGHICISSSVLFSSSEVIRWRVKGDMRNTSLSLINVIIDKLMTLNKNAILLFKLLVRS